MNGWSLIIILILVMLGIYTYEWSQDINRYFREVEYKGHIYLIYANRGVCHSPECKCQTKGFYNDKE